MTYYVVVCSCGDYDVYKVKAESAEEAEELVEEKIAPHEEIEDVIPKHKIKKIKGK